MFLTGLLAGTHCAGMCGGLAAALSLGPPGMARPPPGRLLADNLGRLGSYAAAGALAGGVSGAGFLLGPQQPVQQVLLAAASLMLVALGLHLAGVSRAVTAVERVGRPLWARLAPLTHNLLPVRSATQALALGALWGWLPCGLVYSALVTAFASGDPGRGALTMLAFGLGTLPNLVAVGWFAGRLLPWLRQRGARLAAGAIVAGFGIVGLAGLFAPDATRTLFCLTP